MSTESATTFSAYDRSMGHCLACSDDIDLASDALMVTAVRNGHLWVITSQFNPANRRWGNMPHRFPSPGYDGSFRLIEKLPYILLYLLLGCESEQGHG